MSQSHLSNAKVKIPSVTDHIVGSVQILSLKVDFL
jgi:hypothetical protein